MHRGIMMGGIVFVAILTLSLFQVKYKVVELEDTIRNINSEVFLIEESIHVLKAEWTYRTSPRRLNQLAEKHLKMTLFKAHQFESNDSALDQTISDLPMTQTSLSSPEREE